MTRLTRLSPKFPRELSETGDLVLRAALRVHDSVDRITVHGSRGPKGGERASSDLDLCLVVNAQAISAASDQERLLNEVVFTALDGWSGEVRLDAAAVFDMSGCKLACLGSREFNPNLCIKTTDCMGIYKIPEGYVSGPAVDCRLMYPLAEIWKRSDESR